MEQFPTLGILALLIFSGFFSATETSILSLSSSNLKELKEKWQASFQRIRHLLERPSSLVATIMIGNESANVMLSNVLADYYNIHFQSWGTIVALNLLTAVPLIILFGEITPRVFAAQANVTTIRKVIPFVWVFYKITFPLRFILELFMSIFTKIFKVKKYTIPNVNEDDFLSIVEESKSKGAIHESEKELIENVFEFDDDKISDISIPIKDFPTVHKDTYISAILKDITPEFAPRVPVIGDFPNEIVGVLYTKDLLAHSHRPESKMKVRHIMKEPVFVEPQTPVESIFKRLRQLRVHIAFVQEEDNTVSGVITMNQILEQIFGDFLEEGHKNHE